MKRIFLVFALGLGLIACNDNTSETSTRGSIDSNNTAPDPSSSADHTTVQPDTTLIDSNRTQQGAIGDTNMRKDNPEGNSSGQSGAATNSNNSGSAIDDTKGSK